MNEKSPDSREGGEGSTVVVAVVLTVIVVLAAAVLVGGVFIFFFAVPFSDVSRLGSPTAVTTTQSSVTIAQYEPVEMQEDIGEPADTQPLTPVVDSTTEPPKEAPKEGPGESDIEGVPDEPKDAVAPKEEPVSEPPDMTPPVGETVNDATKPTAKEEVPESGNYQALPQAFERVDVKADDGAPEAVAFSGQKCKSFIWAQPDEDEGVSQVSYMLDGKFATVRGTAGICDADAEQPADKKPSAVFRIYGDGNLLWESEPQTGFGAAQQFEVEVKGIEVLALMAESSSSSELSRFAWGDVELKATDE